MAMPDHKTVDAYIAAQPEPARGVLERVRRAVRNALPKADETLSYKIPMYRLPGGVVIYFAGWKQHYSLYPATKQVVATLREELRPYEVNNKGTIRFPYDKPVPAGLIGRIAKLRAKQVAEEAGANTTRKRPVKTKHRAG